MQRGRTASSGRGHGRRKDAGEQGRRRLQSGGVEALRRWKSVQQVGGGSATCSCSRSREQLWESPWGWEALVGVRASQRGFGGELAGFRGRVARCDSERTSAEAAPQQGRGWACCGRLQTCCALVRACAPVEEGMQTSRSHEHHHHAKGRRRARGRGGGLRRGAEGWVMMASSIGCTRRASVAPQGRQSGWSKVQ